MTITSTGITMISLGLTVLIMLIIIAMVQHSEIKRLKERNKVLRKSNKTLCENNSESYRAYLRTKHQLRKTQKICNVAFESTLRYKKELATLKEAKEVRVEIKTIDFNDFDPEAIGRLLAKQVMAKHIVKDSDVQSSQQSKEGAAS